MSLKFFLVGGVIFAVYMFLTIWNIYNGHKVDKKERQLDNQADQLDMDGMGNFSRFPAPKED